MFSFLHRPIISLHKTSIYRQPSHEYAFHVTGFFYSQKRAAADYLMYINESLKTMLSDENLYCSTEENKSPTSWPGGQ